jgi:hypothetical protein
VFNLSKSKQSFNIMLIMIVMALLLLMALPAFASGWTVVRDYGISSLAPYVVMILAAMLVWLITCAAKALTALASKISNETLRNSIISAISEAQTVATDSVACVKQTYTDAIKAASADGKLTAIEQMTAMGKAKEAFLTSISTKSLTILKEQFDDYMDYITKLIEAKLGLSKSVIAGTSSDPVIAS